MSSKAKPSSGVTKPKRPATRSLVKTLAKQAVAKEQERQEELRQNEAAFQAKIADLEATVQQLRNESNDPQHLRATEEQLDMLKAQANENKAQLDAMEVDYPDLPPTDPSVNSSSELFVASSPQVPAHDTENSTANSTAKITLGKHHGGLVEQSDFPKSYYDFSVEVEEITDLLEATNLGDGGVAIAERRMTSGRYLISYGPNHAPMFCWEDDYVKSLPNLTNLAESPHNAVSQRDEQGKYIFRGQLERIKAVSWVPRTKPKKMQDLLDSVSLLNPSGKKENYPTTYGLAQWKNGHPDTWNCRSTLQNLDKKSKIDAMLFAVAVQQVKNYKAWCDGVDTHDPRNRQMPPIGRSVSVQRSQPSRRPIKGTQANAPQATHKSSVFYDNMIRKFQWDPQQLTPKQYGEIRAGWDAYVERMQNEGQEVEDDMELTL